MRETVWTGTVTAESAATGKGQDLVIPAQVVVGTDGSPSAEEAVRQAALEAMYHGAGLRIVHAIDWVPPPGFATVLSETGKQALRSEGERLLEEGVSTAVSVAPDIEIATTLSMTDPRWCLTELSGEAVLTVVGAGGISGITAGLLGSTARYLAARAAGPLLVVRAASTPSGPVVLGVDGSHAAEAGIDFAFTEAAARGERLVAVHAWSEWNTPPTPPADPLLPYAKAAGELATDEERLLAQAVAGWRSRFPQVSLERRTVRGRVRQSLIETSRSAQLVVVGRRGRGGFTGLRLGSVSTAVLHHAHCSVAVVHGHA